MNSEPEESTQPVRTPSMVPSFLIASIAAIVCVVILVSPISLHDIQPGRLVTDTMVWNGVEIEYTWISTKAIRTYTEESGYIFSETMTFAKGTVTNTGETDLEVDSAVLMLLEQNSVTIGKLEIALPYEWIIEPGNSRIIELEGWIPTALIKEVSSISGRLAFTHEKR